MNELPLVYDVKLPLKLKKTQQWFGSIISQKIDQNSCIHPTTPSGNAIESEAWEYVKPSPTLKPHQRMELYNQQYWWRLLSTMQDIYPFVTRLFGHHDFNQTIACPYLLRYPPDHWSLNMIGRNLPKWIEEEYQAKDRSFVLHAAMIDCAYNESFLSEENVPLKAEQFPHPSDLLEIVDKQLILQPHIYLFKMPYSLFYFRDTMLKESVEHWVENDFPKLPQERTHYTVLFRERNGDVSWEECSMGEFALLSQFKYGVSIEDACQYLEEQEESIAQEVMEGLSSWFQKWVARGWLRRVMSDES